MLIMEKTTLMYEGKAKKVYATNDENYCIVSYKDDATAFNGVKKGMISGKGVINNRMNNLLMMRLEKSKFDLELPYKVAGMRFYEEERAEDERN